MDLLKIGCRRDVCATVFAVREQYAKLGIEPGTLFLAEFSKFVRAEEGKYRAVVKRAAIDPM